MPEHDFRLLALDGGGVRDLSTLQILKQLMDTIDPESPPKPCDYFDIIGGTSTGGLIAIMLSRLRMAVDECIDAYVSLSDRIFQKQRHRVTIKGRVQGRFDSDELERAIKEIVTRQGLAENVLLKDAPNAKCKVCQGFGKELTNLAKMYTEDNKYSGEDDNFDFKFTIFYNLCSRADVPQEAKVKAYPTILRGLALDHYYTNLKNVTMTLSFNQICDATRHYFEGPEYRRGILGQWNSITLRSVMSKARTPANQP